MSVVIKLLKPTKTEIQTVEDLWKEGHINYITLNKSKLNSYNKTVKEIKRKFSSYIINMNDIVIVPCERVVYYQGWFFKPRFFKLTLPIRYATTKEDMERLLYRWLNWKKDGDICKEIYNKLIENWEDGCIFELAW